MKGDCMPCPAPWARTIAVEVFHGSGFRISNFDIEQWQVKTSNPVAPQGAAFGIETGGFKSPFNGRIPGMNFGAHSPNTSLLGVFEQAGDQSAADTFASPLRRDKQRNDIHRFAAKLRPPFITRIGIPAEAALVVLGHDNEPAILSVHNVMKYTAGIVGCTFRPYIGQ
jgi:hypothetical protein